MTPATMVANVLARPPFYRVLAGRLRGLIVGESDTVECSATEGGCDGSGTVWTQNVRYPDEWEERPCLECGGVGRVFGYGVGGATRVALVEGPSGRRR